MKLIMQVLSFSPLRQTQPKVAKSWNSKMALLPCQFVLFLLLGCSDSSNITRDAEVALRSAIDTQSKGQIKLVRFAKNDGRKLEPSGYELLYEAEVEFASDGIWMAGGPLSTGIGFIFEAKSGPEPTGITAQFANQVLNDAGGGKDVVRGSRAQISGSLLGQKYENGWKFRIGNAEIAISAAPSRNEPLLKPDNTAAEINATKFMLQLIETALDTYRLLLATYPTTEQGLEALITKPAFESEKLSEKWESFGPFWKPGTKFNDAWSRPLHYEAYSSGNSEGRDANSPHYSLRSDGPDLRQGTLDDVTLEKRR